MSKKFCFVGVNSLVYEGLRKLIPLDMHIQRVTSLASFISTSEQDIHQIDAVVLGAFIGEPLHIAQRIRAFDRYIPILILSTSEQDQVLKNKFIFCPFLGQDVNIWLSDQLDDISNRLIELARLTHKKRTYQATIIAAQKQLDIPNQSNLSLHKATKTKHHLFDFLEHVPIGIITADRNNQVVNINKKALRILNHSDQTQHKDHPLSDIVPSTDKKRLLAFIDCYRYAKQPSTSLIIPNPEIHADKYLEFSIVTQSYQQFQGGKYILLLQDATNFIRSQQVCGRLEKDLEDSQTDFQSVCSAITEAIFLYNPIEDKILFANQAFKEFYGYSLDGQSVFRLHQLCQTTAPYSIEDLRYWINKAQESKQPVCIEWQAMNNWGERVYIELYIRAQNKLETTCLLFVTRDISDRKSLEDELAHQHQLEIDDTNHNLQALEGYDLVNLNNLVSNLAIRFINLPIEAIRETIQQSLCTICEFIGINYAYLDQHDPETELTGKFYEWLLPINSSDEKTPAHLIQTNKWLKQEVSSKNILCINHIDPLEQRQLQDLNSLGIKSLLAIPLRHGMHITGLICLGSLTQPHEWTDTNVFLLKRIGEIFAEVLQRQVYEMTLNATESLMLEAHNKLYHEAHQDGLTGIPNRRFFDEIFESEARRALRSHKQISILLCDIDYFKNYNDSQGHLKGDECLKQVAQTIENNLKRSGEFVARFGGEEFVAVLSDTQKEDAQQAAENLRQAIWNLNIPHRTSKVADRVTISIGVSTMKMQSLKTCQLLLTCADEALYKAKEQGRNCITINNG